MFSELQLAPTEGRAFLLPLLAEHTTNTSLKHFAEYFVPLSEKLFELRMQAETKEKMIEVKIWETCVEQVWACFKGYCEACIDVPEVCAIECYVVSSADFHL